MRAAAIFLRGLAMGAADIVPGVSGGTVAFITGIYPRLLGSLRSFDLAWLASLRAGDVGAAWRHVDGGFLVCLLAGILCSVFSLARLISWLLQSFPEPLWALFFGLILASALLLYRQVEEHRRRERVLFCLGLLVALSISMAPGASFPQGASGVFLAGFIAICAMILPGISGSFILVLLGMYAAVLGAVKQLDLWFLMVFALGAGCGLLCFSRLLFWLLSRFRSQTVSLLTGFLFGSLTAVWPWKRVLQSTLDQHGAPQPLRQWPVMPGDYLLHTGEEPMLYACLLAASMGFISVWWIDRRWGKLQIELS